MREKRSRRRILGLCGEESRRKKKRDVAEVRKQEGEKDVVRV